MIVLGVGNELLRDEGVGVHAVRELAGRDYNFPVEIIEAGTVPDCCPADRPISKLIVIDAAYGGGQPGTIYKFSPEDLEFEVNPITSMHQFGLLDNLRLGEIIGIKPQTTVIIGIEPKKVEWGLELSEEVRDRISDIVALVLKEITPSQGTG